ncbi:MAG: hypothetical protein N2489_10180 [Clostridia bacterium]|nr:hypothetical protein [Clostridia bacterium]
MNPLDMLLLPKSTYNKLTNNRFVLYTGIILVGIRDIGLFLWEKLPGYFAGKPQEVVLSNGGILLAAVLIMGIMDVLFFSYPLYDLLSFIKKRREGDTHSATAVKVMKVYILANLIVTPLDVAALSIASHFGNNLTDSPYLIIVQVLSILAVIMYYGIITRGVSVLFNHTGLYTLLILITVILYSDLLSYIFRFLDNKVLITLLR